MFSVTRHNTDFDVSDKSGHDPEELFHITSVNLIVVARLQVEDHLSVTKGMFTIQRPGTQWIPLALLRWYYSQSRESAIGNIKCMYDNAAWILRHMELSDKDRTRIKKLIRNSHKGIRKLQTTYIKDVNVVARLAAMTSSTTGGLFALPESPKSKKVNRHDYFE
jgi:hypothetical protein